MSAASAATDEKSGNKPAGLRRFGRFVLMELLGRSDFTMAWRVHDSRSRLELVLVLPRVQPAGAPALARWEQAVARAARLQHPHLAAAIEVSNHDGWPYAAYEIAGLPTLSQALGDQGLAPRDAATLARQLGEALAYAHEAGVAHGDLQPFLVAITDGGEARLFGMGCAGGAAADSVRAAAEATGRDAAGRQAEAQRDVLALGLVLHRCLTGQLPLDEADVSRVISRLPPQGREMVRLPWNTPRPVPDALRAIANRATDRQERQRYRSPRTLIHALEGWLKADAAAEGGALALLLDRLHAVGVLPASPGGADRAARIALMERERTIELAEAVMQDVALSFELVRAVNTATVRGAQISGTGPVLTVRRAIAMLGLDGVRRAALALRPWPGPLDESGAAELAQLMQRSLKAARVAQLLRPPAYDAEVTALVTLMQNLGPLVIQYHYPDDARQIRRLMQPAPAGEPGAAEEPGMSEQAASYAVLGIDVETVGGAVARHWGLDEAVAQMIRRQPLDKTIHTPESDDEVLRVVASCANEAVEATAQPPQRVAAALNKVVQRYGRALGLTLVELQEALWSARASTAPPVHTGAGTGTERRPPAHATRG